MSSAPVHAVTPDPRALWLAISPAGGRIAWIDAAGVVRCRADGGPTLVVSKKPRVTALGFLDDSTLLLGDIRGCIRAVDANGAALWEVSRHKGAVSGLTMRHGELVSVGKDGTLQIGVAAAKPQRLARRSRPFTSVHASPAGDIAAGSEGRSLVVWSPGGGERFSDRSSSAAAERVMFLDAGRFLLTTHGTREMLWDLDRGILMSAGGDSHRVVAASDPAHGRLVSARRNGLSIRALAPAAPSTTQGLAPPPRLEEHHTLDASVCSLAIRGGLVAVGVDDGRVLTMSLA